MRVKYLAGHGPAGNRLIWGTIEMRVLLGTVLAAIALGLVVDSAEAAEREVAAIARITGEAVVSSGTRYVSGIEGMGLRVGTRVMSLAKSTTVIQFDDGCRYTLEENQLLTIDDRSPCVLGLVLPDGGAVTAGGAPGALGGAAGSLSQVPVAAVGAVAVAGWLLKTGGGTGGERPPISE